MHRAIKRSSTLVFGSLRACSAITGSNAASGEAMVLGVDGTGRPPVVGTIEPQ